MTNAYLKIGTKVIYNETGEILTILDIISDSSDAVYDEYYETKNNSGVIINVREDDITIDPIRIKMKILKARQLKKKYCENCKKKFCKCNSEFPSWFTINSDGLKALKYFLKEEFKNKTIKINVIDIDEENND